MNETISAIKPFTLHFDRRTALWDEFVEETTAQLEMLAASATAYAGALRCDNEYELLVSWLPTSNDILRILQCSTSIGGTKIALSKSGPPHLSIDWDGTRIRAIVRWDEAHSNELLVYPVDAIGYQFADNAVDKCYATLENAGMFLRLLCGDQRRLAVLGVLLEEAPLSLDLSRPGTVPSRAPLTLDQYILVADASLAA